MSRGAIFCEHPLVENGGTEAFSVNSKEVALWWPLLGKGMRWLSFLAAIGPLAIMVVGGGMFGMERPDAWRDIVSGSWVTAAIAGVGSFFLTTSMRKKKARVKADSAGLEVTYENGSTRSIASSEIRQAAVVADVLTPGIALDLSRGRSMSVRTPSVEEAQRLVAALSLGEKQARYRTMLAPRLLGAAGGCLSLGAVFALTIGIFGAIKAGFPGVLGGSLWLGGVAGVLALLFLFTSGPKIEVGADGVFLRELWNTRFVAFRELESIRADSGRVEMRYRDGRAEQVRLSQMTRDQVTALDDRLSRAFAAAQGDTGGRASVLDRAGRTMAEWRAHLAALIARGEGYREAALTREEAEAVLAAGDATPEHRLGAAMALVASDRDRARDRLRVAAEGCANPRLRVALSELSEGEIEDGAVAEALEGEPAAAARQE